MSFAKTTPQEKDSCDAEFIADVRANLRSLFTAPSRAGREGEGTGDEKRQVTSPTARRTHRRKQADHVPRQVDYNCTSRSTYSLGTVESV